MKEGNKEIKTTTLEQIIILLENRKEFINQKGKVKLEIDCKDGKCRVATSFFDETT